MSRRQTVQRMIPYLVLGLALASGLLAVRPALDFLDRQLHGLQTSLVAAIERATGLKVRYSHLSPSLLLRADINDVRLERPDGSVFFAADQVCVTYSILDFLTKPPLEAVRAVEVAGAVLRFDLERDGSRLLPTSSPTQVAASPDPPALVREVMDQVSRYIPPGIRLSFLESSVFLTGRNMDLGFRLGQASLEASPEKLDLSLALRLDRAIAGELPWLGGIQGRLQLDAQYFRQTRQFQTQLATEAITSRWGTLAPQKLSLIIDKDEIRLNRIVDQEPVDLQVRWDFQGNAIELAIQSDNWQAGSQFRPAKDLGEWGDMLLAGRYTADLKARYRLADGSFDYRGSLGGHASLKSPDDVRFELVASGDQSRLPSGRLALEIPGLKLDYASTGRPDRNQLAGDLRVWVADPWLPTPLEVIGPVRIGLDRAGGRADMPVAHGSLGGFPLVADTGSVDFSPDRGIGFRLNCRPAQTRSAGTQVSLDGRLKAGKISLKSRFVQLRVAESGGLVQPIALLAGAGDPGPVDLSFLPADLEADADLLLETDPVTNLTLGGLSLTTAALDESAGPRRVLRGVLTFDGHTLQLHQALVDAPQLRLTANAALDLGEDGSQSLHLELADGAQAPWSFTAYRSAAGDFSLQGPYGLFASGREEVAAGKGVSATVSFQAYPVKLLGERANLSGSLAGHIDQAGRWSVRIQSLDLLSVALNPLNDKKLSRLTIRDGTIGPEGAEISDFRYQDSQSSLSGKGSLEWTLDRLPDFRWKLDLHGAPSLQAPVVNPRPELLSIQGGYLGGSVQSSVVWTDAPLGRFIDETLRGYFDLSLDLSLRPDAPLASLDLSGRLKTPRAFLNKDPVDLSAAFSFRKKNLRFDSLDLGLLEHRLHVAAMQADFVAGSLSAAAEYRSTASPGARPMSLQAQAGWNPLAASLESALFDGLRAELNLRDLPGIDNQTHDYHFTLNGSGGSLAFTETGSQILRGRVRQDGSFQCTAQKPFPVTGNAGGLVRAGKIEANITNIGLDLADFSRFLDLKVFKLSAGNLGGAIRVVGDINDPDFFGSLRGTGVRARVGFLPDELSAERAVLVFEEKKIRLLSAGVQVGSTTARAEGEFTINRMNVESVAIRADVPPEGKGVHIMGDFPMVNVDGWAKGNLGITWRGNTLRIQGQVQAQDALLELAQYSGRQPAPAASPPASPQPEEETLYYDVNLGVTSGKAVQFFWPNRSAPILSTYLDLDQSIRIVFSSLSGNWNILGNLKSRGGELAYLKRNFLIREASLVFNENQDKFDPLINGRAETRMNSGNQAIKVSLVLENNSLSKLTPRIVTDVPLTTEQLSALLTGDTLASTTTDSLGVKNFYNAVSAGASTLSQVYVVGPLMDNLLAPVRSALGVDLISFRTNLVSNMVVDTAFNLAGYNPLDNQSVPFGKYLDNTTLQVGKFFGNDVYGEVLTRLRSVSSTRIDPNTVGGDFSGFLKTASNTLGLGAELELNMEWETPFFNLDWSSNLQDMTSVDKWLKSNSFTFSWRLQ